MFECAFIYVAPGLDPQKQRAEIPSTDINMNVVGCANYSQAVEVAKELVAKGCTALELCAGFGNEGIAMIKRAVGPGIAVGAIKFDFHPAFGFKSGDELFDDTKTAEEATCPDCGDCASCASCSMENFCNNRDLDLPPAKPRTESLSLQEWMKTIK